nr:MAG TPA: hypothetical protein [Caudoviricetes sp.]
MAKFVDRDRNDYNPAQSLYRKAKEKRIAKVQADLENKFSTLGAGSKIGETKTLSSTYKGKTYSNTKWWDGSSWSNKALTMRPAIETKPLPDAQDATPLPDASTPDVSGGGAESPNINTGGTGGTDVSGSPSFEQNNDNIFGFRRTGKRGGLSSLLGF